LSEYADSNRWLMHGHCPERRLRLYCFSHAGGDASAFHPWQAPLAPEVQVCAVRLPGRGSRFCEAPSTSLSIPVAAIAEAVAADATLPFWFLGHSMGALMAYEVARYLVVRDMPCPVGLFASGCEAPVRLRSKPLRTALDDDALIEALGRFNGVPSEVLQHRELMTLMLPILRADLTMVESYVHAPEPRLGIPIEVLAGTADPLVEGGGLDGWAETTTGPCRVHWFDGDHFFINSQRAAVLQLVRQCLLPVAHRTARIDA
jgi:surfactin synthase thioesterase subunit